MEDLLSFKRCSFCNLFSAIQCMMQELKDHHVRKSHSLEKINNDCVQNVQKQNVDNKKLSLNLDETTTVAEVSFKTERIKERSDEYFRDDSADDKINYGNDDTNYDIAVSIMKDYNEDTMENDDANFDNNDDNSNFTNETNNDNGYNIDESIFNSNETTMNVEDKNDFTDTDQDNLKNVSVTDRIISIPSNADGKENESKIRNHFQIKKDTKIDDVCNYCGKILKRSAGSFLKHLRYKHKDKLPIQQHRSIAWNHFNPVPSDSKKAECKYCGKWMSKIYGSTSSLINHLKIKHQHQLVNIESIEKVKPTPLRKSIIWSHCKLEPISDKIECNYCNKAYINIQGSTSNMKNHLKNKHPQKLYGKGSKSSFVEAEEGLMDMLIHDKGTFNNYEDNYSNVATSELVDQNSIDEGEDSNFGDEYSEFSATTEINEDHASMDIFLENEPDNESDEKYNNTKDTKYKFTMNDNDPDDALRVLDTKEFQQSIDDQNLISTKVGLKKSIIWSHCKLEPISDKIECNYCNKVYINSQGSTSNMKTHLKNKHPQKLCEKGSEASLLLDNFKPQPDAHRKTECKYCGVCISNSNGSTTQMLKHVRIEHEDLMKSRTNERKINDKKSNRSLVWDYFNPPEISVMKCSYSTCGELFSNPDGNKSDMIKHLQVKHPNKIEAFKEETEEKSI